MPSLPRQAFALAALALLLTSCARPFGRQYEYEEEIYVSLDGSATMTVNTSMAALAALHGLDVAIDPAVPVDRDRIRALYSTPVTTVTRVSRPWRRDGRRFVQVRLEVADVRRLSQAPPFAWAHYAFTQKGDVVEFVQELGPSVAKNVGDVGWDGEELVAVRLHIPSRVTYHNAPSHLVERGNILSWEQPLKARLAGEPLRVEARFGVQRILVLTVALFLSALAAAAVTLGGLIWWVVRKGHQRAARQS
ncbi:hypothetical protein LuPra_00497 [Luteitalea pratensis]|uniref:DUF3153 domain-containing protein n=1 Tax=Luteitalea pratensis TaxID=1855912 RepID=A0A143PGD4_LUTPR|nr:hypothetical protein [Luteitalea pratensis]AMY07330.1 hypothetical protein LuPra_00497 [Luteitalea pratensis]